MKSKLIFTSLIGALLLLTLATGVFSFVVPVISVTNTVRTTSPLGVVLSGTKNTKEQEEDFAKQPMSFKKVMRIMVTGSFDGIHQLGKPQFDWGTGKVATKRKNFNWNTSPTATSTDGKNKNNKNKDGAAKKN